MVDPFNHIAEQIRQSNLTDRQALEELVWDNPDLERLEALLDEFNIFEAIGMVTQEIRHSAFLAFMLDPRQNHGFGDTFLKKMLQKALVGSRDSSPPINLIDLDVWSLNNTLVLREWNNIDIFLLDEVHHFAVIIENKIGSAEHSNQLARYYRIVEEHYPGYPIIGLYLTPDSDLPSDPRYLPFSYRLLVDLIENLAQSRASFVGTEIQTLMIHYAKMLRRHIVSESEIDEICRRLYQRHKRALDLIIEHRPDRQAEIKEALEDMIKSTPDIKLHYNTKSNLGFHPTDWDLPILQSKQGPYTSALLLEFHFINEPNQLKLILVLNPGTPEVRQRLFDIVLTNIPPFNPPYKTLYTTSTVYTKVWLTKKDLEEADMSSLKTTMYSKWEHFMQHDLSAIQTVLRAEEWISQEGGDVVQ